MMVNNKYNILFDIDSFHFVNSIFSKIPIVSNLLLKNMSKQIIIIVFLKPLLSNFIIFCLYVGKNRRGLLVVFNDGVNLTMPHPIRICIIHSYYVILI